MGISRDANTQIQYPRLDPFDLCDDVAIDVEPSMEPRISASSHQKVNMHPKSAATKLIKSKKTMSNPSAENNLWLSVKRGSSNYLLVGLFVVASGVLSAKYKPWAYFSEPALVYAYFEVRALDADGRPIAGAVVKNAGKRVGTTDSFGEWRRYMKVPLGATVPVTLAKKSNGTVLYATKNFAVPPFKPEKSEIELHSSVQLLVAESGDSQAQTAAATLPHDMSGASGDLAKNPAETDALRRLPSDLIRGSIRVQSPQVAERSKSEAAPTQISAFRSDHETISLEVTGQSTENLAKEVLPALTLRAREMGIRVESNSPWKVRLTNLIDKPKKIAKDGGGLILVTMTDGESQSPRTVEFLRNYQADARTTARGILFGLINHVNKNVLMVKRGEKWAAVLPKTSARLWHLAPNSILVNQQNSVTLGTEEYMEDGFRGYFVKSPAPLCADQVNACIAQTRSYTEVPPVQSWRRLKLKIPQLNKESVKIFVSGYEARPAADKVFEYWGADKLAANVAVIQGGKVLIRSHIVGDANGIAVLGLPAVSRR